MKGISITFPRGAWNSAPRMPVIDDSKLFGLVPIGDRMRISGSAEITGYDTTPAMPRAQAIIDNASYHLPGDAAASRSRDGARSGQACGRSARPARRSSAQHAIGGLWVNAGHGHLGWTLACGSGRVAGRSDRRHANRKSNSPARKARFYATAA